MREIKFRGFGIVQKRWFYGNLIEKHDPTKKEDVVWCRFIQDKALSMDQVDIESVGQFTGLKDKNGKEIYEGDIVTSSHGELYEVCFIGSGWKIKSIKHKTRPNSLRGLIHKREVIGNIYQNPELLK